MKRLLLQLALLTWSFLFLTAPAATQDQKKMTAHFINVGQADATLLEFPCGAILIDAGAQGPQQEASLIAYLHQFFQRRSDLNNTLDLVIITHAHIDHNLALDNVVNAFTVKRYIDNGLKVGSGKKNQLWLQNNAKALGITYGTYSFEKITSGDNSSGVTDTIIDPLNCAEVDPEIVLLSGRFTHKPAGWSESDYQNGNNHSVVVKVSFGAASFLFTGDLETDGIQKLLTTYDASMLDVDVLRVGHHGAANATTPGYLNAVTPGYAVISCGAWTFGKSGGNFTTYAYGHPRKKILDQLADVIPGDRSSPIIVKAATAAKHFIDYTVRKRIYATPWDASIQISADDEGNYRVTRGH
jgi:beta-lactamase superfamily II metal-dependent hydrolase